MGARQLKADLLRLLVKKHSFRVKPLAIDLGVDVRTLERHFSDQFQMTPKAWIMNERMTAAPSLLLEGRSNKEVAQSLKYSCQSNFCRDFKRHFGRTPKQYVRAQASS